MNRDDEAETDTPLAPVPVPIANEANGLATTQAFEPHRLHQVTVLHVVEALFGAAVGGAAGSIASIPRPSGRLMRSLAGRWSMKSRPNTPILKSSLVESGGAV
ncbi:hypothetical protein [Halalkalirubrum salinum]|uniref:hypothetical protein n=1 Tax=Halalkalirubrum salinum TaxID=2563889 RepID=UPI0010FB86DF|nr:hypothetical protein [Halalkalirubrum salinum]